MAFQKIDRNSRGRFNRVAYSCSSGFAPQLRIPMPLAERVGIRPGERVSVGVGDGPDAGKLLIAADADGFTADRLGRKLRVNLPRSINLPPSPTITLEHEETPAGLVVTLPGEWAQSIPVAA